MSLQCIVRPSTATLRPQYKVIVVYGYIGGITITRSTQQSESILILAQKYLLGGCSRITTLHQQKHYVLGLKQGHYFLLKIVRDVVKASDNVDIHPSLLSTVNMETLGS